MPASNFERMIQLATEVFDSKNDPDQLDVNEEVIGRLQQMHPSTLSEYNDNGPVVWILVIPTSTELMNKFLKKEITEQELLYLTPINCKYEALYLCSAMVLPEYRGKGIAKKLTVEAITNIKKQHTINTLFVWPFSAAGDSLAKNIADAVSLPLLKRAI